jgi:hypothetical protein
LPTGVHVQKTFALVAGDYGIGIGQSSADIQFQSNVRTTA